MACDLNAMMAQGTCFMCLTPDMRQSVRIRLLCAIANFESNMDTSATSLMASATCFLCLTPQQRDAIEAYILCQISRSATVTCNPTSLMAAAGCYSCLPSDVLKGIQLYALCSAINAIPAADCNASSLASLAACFICNRELQPAMRAALYCAWSQGSTVACNPSAIVATAGAYIGQPTNILEALELALVVATYTQVVHVPSGTQLQTLSGIDIETLGGDGIVTL